MWPSAGVTGPGGHELALHTYQNNCMECATPAWWLLPNPISYLNALEACRGCGVHSPEGPKDPSGLSGMVCSSCCLEQIALSVICLSPASPHLLPFLVGSLTLGVWNLPGPGVRRCTARSRLLSVGAPGSVAPRYPLSGPSPALVLCQPVFELLQPWPGSKKELFLSHA